MPGELSEDSELAVVERLRRATGMSPVGEVWAGDDTAVVGFGNRKLLFATDVTVEGVHFDRRLGTLADVGWRALVQNLSDVAAMGGVPRAAVAGVAGASATEIDALYEGLLEAAGEFSCPLVGGDLSEGASLMVSVAIVGDPGLGGPVLRSGGCAGDALFVTGPLGAAAAGLRALREEDGAPQGVVRSFLRPQPRLAEGAAARHAGARAMIDVSDGFGIDLHRLAEASGIGVRVDEVPVAEGASDDDAQGGGEDFELIFAAPDAELVRRAFAVADLRTPLQIGVLTQDQSVLFSDGRPLEPTGYVHRLG